MKKLLAMMLVVFVSMSAKAQLYKSSEINVSFASWSDISMLETLKNNGGEEVNWSVGMGPFMPAIATILVDNKFLSLGFYEGMIPSVNLPTFDGWDNMPFFQMWQSLEEKSDFSGKIDYSMVFYRSDYRYLYIPFVSQAGGRVYALVLELRSNESGIENIEAERTTGNASFYNMQGMKTDQDAKGQIIIKKEGNKVTKFINR